MDRRFGSWETSVGSIEDWERQFGDVLQRVDPDLMSAMNKLDLGERNVVRARRDLDADDPDSALIHAENAMVNAADAVLARDGYRLRDDLALGPPLL